MLPEKRQIENFDNVANSLIAWQLSADSLLVSAKLLKGNRDNFDPDALNIGDPVPDEGKVLFPEIMLMGYAFECLLKALWLKNGNKIAENGAYKSVKGIAAHDLPELAKAAGLNLSSKERDILRRVFYFMRSAGRYPTPMKWEQNKIQKLFGGGKGLPVYWTAPSDDDELKNIFERSQCQLDE